MQRAAHGPNPAGARRELMDRTLCHGPQVAQGCGDGRSPDVQLIFQDDSREAFVTLNGHAQLVTDPDSVRGLWRSAYDAYFPSEDDRTNAIFVAVKIDQMRLWIRGVTPEPFGLQPVVLNCDEHGNWS